MRILIVEDDRKVARFLRRALEEEGYAVDTVADGIEGAVRARVEDYDLLVLDVMLPGKSGFEITRGPEGRGLGSDSTSHGARLEGRHRRWLGRRRR